MTFPQWQQRIFDLYMAGRYTEALDHIDEGLRVYPEQEITVLYYKACLLGRADQHEAAVAALSSAEEKGYWYAPSAFKDMDLRPLQGRPDFEVVKASLLQRHAELLAQSKPALKLLQPDGACPWPTLLALHGNGQSIGQAEPHWAPAAQHGWQVALAQSRFPSTPGAYVWDQPEDRVADLARQYKDLQQTDGLVISGFSRGCDVAVRAVFTGAIPARGVLAVAPSITPLDPLLELMAAATHKPRLYLLVGDQDSFSYGPTVQFAEAARAHGLVCELKVYQGLKHVFPPDFESLLPAALAWLHQGGK